MLLARAAENDKLYMFFASAAQLIAHTARLAMVQDEVRYACALGVHVHMLAIVVPGNR